MWHRHALQHPQPILNLNRQLWWPAVCMRRGSHMYHPAASPTARLDIQLLEANLPLTLVLNLTVALPYPTSTLTLYHRALHRRTRLGLQGVPGVHDGREHRNNAKHL